MIGQVFLTIIILTFLCGIGSITMSLITENKYQQPVMQKKVVKSQYETSVDNQKSASVFIDDYNYDDILED
jgi:hypothetical protein